MQSWLNWTRISIDCDPLRVAALLLGRQGRNGRPWSCQQVSEGELNQAHASLKLPFLQ